VASKEIISIDECCELKKIKKDKRGKTLTIKKKSLLSKALVKKMKKTCLLDFQNATI
jgi:hypothetical protein